MKKINIVVLLIALLAIGLGVMLSSGKRQTEIASDHLFPELQKHVDRVASLRVKNANGMILDAVLVDNNWRAADKANYPLNQENVVRLLNNLVQAKLDSAKTAKPENHARLGLQNISVEDSQAQLLELKAGERSWQLLVGNSASSGNGLFVRKPDDHQTWLTKTPLTLPDDSNAWLKAQILDLSADQLVSVNREGQWQAILSKEQVTDGAVNNWTLENMPQGRELSYDSIVKNTVEDILALELEELVQQKPYDFGDVQPESKISLITQDQGIIEIALYKSDEDNLVVYQSDSDAHWNNWVFKVSQFQAGRLTKDLESFLQDLPEDSGETEEAPNP